MLHIRAAGTLTQASLIATARSTKNAPADDGSIVVPGLTYIASGYAGQVIWVHAPLDLVVATNATVSAESAQRGQAMRLIRGRIFQAAQKRLALNK